MTPEMKQLLEQEAGREANLHVSKELNYDRWWTGVCCYIAGATSSSTVKRLMEENEKIKKGIAGIINIFQREAKRSFKTANTWKDENNFAYTDFISRGRTLSYVIEELNKISK